MTTPAKQHSRADRLRDYAQAVEQARATAAALGALVRGREARSWTAGDPPEVVFAETRIDGRALPAAVWVALRRDDPEAAVEAMTTVSQRPFLVSSREEMGAGYRLQTVEETLPLPEVDLLVVQLAAALGIPADVLTVLGEWGPDDPRTGREIDALLDRRFGPVADPAGVTGGAPAGLTLTVAEASDVLQLTEAQQRVLATLVRRVGVTITA